MYLNLFLEATGLSVLEEKSAGKSQIRVLTICFFLIMDLYGVTTVSSKLFKFLLSHMSTLFQCVG